MEQFLLSALPASVAGMIGYSAGLNRHQQEQEKHSQDYENVSTELERLKDNLSKSGLLIRGTHKIMLCNPLNTLFNQSIENNDENGMQTVLRYAQDTFNINSLDNNGSTALHIAARKKNEYCMKFLCTLGAEPNTLDVFGMAPIHYAAQANDIETMAHLIHFGADLNIKNHANCTPLMIALQANKKNATAFLLTLKHRRAEIDRAPSPDHSANLLGSFSMALELQRESAKNSHQNDSNDTISLIFEAFLKRNPECPVCCNDLTGDICITKCCEKAVCCACAHNPLWTKKHCFFCRKPLDPEPYIIHTITALARPQSPSLSASSSSSAAASSSPSRLV